MTATRSTSKPGVGLTAEFVDSIADLWSSPVPEEVLRHSSRTLLNSLGVAIGGSHHHAVDIVLSVAAETGGRPVVSVPGRTERTDPYYAAIATGLAAHVDDFDDTHLATVIHPGSVALPATLGLAQLRGKSGDEFLRAFILACEAQLRVAEVMTPSHFEAGWHVTGTCGVIGAAVGAGLLCDLNRSQLANAIGIAASQTVGVREAHGTMIKAAHPGKAAANGVLAALMSEAEFSGPRNALEAPRGFFAVLAETTHPVRLIDGMGDRWELLENTFKPYPSGVVTHPIIDAGLALAARIPSAADIAEIDVTCHPLVVELTGAIQPASGLASKFSAAHCVAIALVDRVVGLTQFTDERAADPAVARIRNVVQLAVDPELTPDEAIVIVRLKDGASHSEHVRHARGSLERPLSDDELLSKVEGLVNPVLPDRAAEIGEVVRQLPKATGIGQLLAAITPRAT